MPSATGAGKLPPQNSGKSGRKPPEGKRFEKGKSGNPGGRPKNHKSITYWINEFGNISPKEAAERCKVYARELAKGGDALPIFGIIAVRALMELMNEPNGSLLNQVLDRTEGKVAQPIATWKDKVIDGLRKGDLEPDKVIEELGVDLATELFNAAGVPVSESRETPADSHPAPDSGE